jgi:hypothetical protein
MGRTEIVQNVNTEGGGQWLPRWTTPADQLRLMAAETGIDLDWLLAAVVSADLTNARPDWPYVGVACGAGGQWVAWCRDLTGDGGYRLLGLAPVDESPAPGCVDGATLYPAGRPWSARWITRWRAHKRVRKRDPARIAERALDKAPEPGDYAYGLQPNRRCLLVRVATVWAAEPATVQLTPDGETVPAAALDVATWWIARRWQLGFDHLWTAGRVDWSNYGILVIMAANWHKRLVRRGGLGKALSNRQQVG